MCLYLGMPAKGMTMSHQTYWLNSDDAEFVIGAVQRYDHVTRAQAEQATDPGLHEPVYEITVTRHDRSAVLGQRGSVEYPTLLSTLLEDARRRRDE